METVSTSGVFKGLIKTLSREIPKLLDFKIVDLDNLPEEFLINDCVAHAILMGKFPIRDYKRHSNIINLYTKKTFVMKAASKKQMADRIRQAIEKL